MKKITLLLSFLVVGLTQAQDTCATALPITAGTHVVTAVNGTDLPPAYCADNGSLGANGKAEWYTYTPTQNYTVTITSDIAANTPRVDTRVHVYTGSCGAMVCFDGDDDSGQNYSSVATFNVTAGTTYTIVWDNRWTNNGFTFQLIENAVVVQPTAPITYNAQTVSTINNQYNICVVDMNNDGLDDIVGISTGTMKIHYQTATPGTFNIVSYPFSNVNFYPSWSLAAGDYNKDGYNDIVLGAGQGLSILRSGNNGTQYTGITPGEYIFCQRTNFADLNKDGNLDIFSCHDINENVYYLNDGAGNLTYYQANVTPGAMAISNGGGNYATLFTDFDNDGDSDVFISKCSGPPCQLIRYDGGTTYTNVSAATGVNVTPIQTWSSGIADFDNDGDMDVIITASAGSHRFFRNNFETTGTLSAFTNITTGSGWDTNTSTNIDNIAYDFDNDGKVDVLGGGNKIMFNQGNNTFQGVTYTGIGVGAVGDLNNDGFLDIQNGSTIRYAVPNGNNWLKVRLNGVQSNSNGIGARIEIYGAFGKQIRDVRSGEGFRYMSSINAHFGIGTNTAITQVIIRWPSGIVDTINNPNINQLLTVTEGSSLNNPSFDSTTVSVFPIPTRNLLTIKTQEGFTAVQAEVYDLNGRLVLSSKIENESISLQSLENGNYLLMVMDANGAKFTQKIVKN